MTNLILLYLSITQFSPMMKLDPKLSWYTLESNHFSVHFSNKGSFEDQEKLAREIVWYCEDAHNRLVPYMRWQPKQKTNVVIGDIYDYVSGWASPFPNNIIFICPTFQKKMIVNYNNWFEHLIIHEYTHILHMDMAHGIPKFFRKIFGKIITPNAVMPLCFNEGFSVFNETKFTGSGRSRSTYHRMMIRSAVLDNKVFPIDKCVTYELAQFPRGETPYFYGSMFYEYLANKYGEDKLADYSNWYSGGFPLFINTQAKRVYGKSFYALWQDFKKEITDKYQSEVNNIKQNLVSQTTQITFEGVYTESPIFSPDGNKIYYVSQNSDEYPAIKCCSVGVYPRQTNYRGRTRSVAIATSALQVCAKTKTLVRKPISSPIRISQDGSKLVFSIQDFYKNFYTYDDIYIYDITNKRLNRLTKGFRATDPDFSPAENKIVFVKNELGQTNLFIMDLDSNKITQLTNSDDYNQYSQPKYSPDGKKVAVSIWKPGGLMDIYILDLPTEWFIPVTQDRSIDIHPFWSSDGQYLLFSSDRTGIFNIYAYHLKDQKLYRVTNVLTGAFAPNLSADNQKLAFLLYSSKGYDIHMMDINLDSLSLYEPIVDDTLTMASINRDTVILSNVTLYHYNQFPSILPKFWLPLAMYNNDWSIGGITGGSDALFQYQYIVQGLYNLETKKPTIDANLIIDKYFPTVNINGVYDQGEIQGNLSSTFSWLKTEHRQNFGVSYIFKKEDYIMSGISLSYAFSNAKFYPYSISPEQGRSVSVNIERYEKLLYSKYNLLKMTSSITQYLNLPFRHHTLMLNAKGKFSFGGTIANRQYKLAVRGYTGTEIEKQHIFNFTAEYRFPLFWIERGLGTSPLFFKNISGTIFYDWGNAINNRQLNLKNSSKSVGAELHINTLFFYELPVSFSLGFGYCLSQPRPSQIYFILRPSFLDIFSTTSIKTKD